MGTSIFAIDIQHDQISSVLLDHGLKGTQIVKTDCTRIVQQSVEDEPLQAVKSALEKLLSTMGDSHDRCVVSIPSDHFFFRTIELPFKHKKKISQILSFELESYLPCPVEEVVSDFCLLEKNPQFYSDKNMAAVASIKNTVLEEFKTIFDAVGIYPDVVTTGSGYTEVLLFAAKTTSELSFFVNVEPGLASIYAVLSGEIVFARTLQINSDTPVEPIKKMVLQTLLSVNELFNNSFELNEIIISGTASVQKKIKKDFEEDMDVVVQAFEVFKTIKIKPAANSSAIDSYAPVQNAIALGFSEAKGLETYNFTRQVSGLAVFYQENKANLLVLLILSFFLFSAWAINPITRVNRLQERIEHLDNSIVQVFRSCFPDVKTIVDPVHQMRVKMDKLKDEKTNDYFNEYPLSIDLLHSISGALPSSLDIIFLRFVRTENNLLISGSADQFNTIDKMKNQFKKIEYFKEVDINSASMDKMDKRVRFNLKILL